MATEERPSTPPTTAYVKPRHARKGSITLSPFWAAAPNSPDGADDDQAIASPRVSARGIIEVPMEEIAFFPLPLDDCASDQRAQAPEKRISRRISASREAQLQRVPSVVQAEEELVDIDGISKMTIKDNSTKSVSSDTTVASSSDSIRSEFSENTAGSKFVVVVVAVIFPSSYVLSVYANSFFDRHLGGRSNGQARRNLGHCPSLSTMHGPTKGECMCGSLSR